MQITLEQIIEHLQKIGNETYFDLDRLASQSAILDAVAKIARPLSCGGYSEVFIVDELVIRVSLGVEDNDGYHNWMMLLRESTHDWTHAPDILYYELFADNNLSFTVMPKYHSVQYDKKIQHIYEGVKYAVRMIPCSDITSEEFIKRYYKTINNWSEQYSDDNQPIDAEEYLPLAIDMHQIYQYTEAQAHIYTDFHDENIMWDDVNKTLILTDPIC